MSISLPPKGDAAKKLGSYFSPLKVEAQATPNMTVKVAEGSFWTEANEHMEYIGGTSPTISAPGSLAKWVLVTVTNTGMLNIVDGAASGTPVLPAPSSYKDELPLAAIFVGDTTTVITNDMVYDLRPLWSIPPDSVSQSQLNDFATITYVDNGLNTKANIANTSSPDFTLNFNNPSFNSGGLWIDRVAGPNVAIRFNETAMTGSPPSANPAWEFTNDGVTWNPIGVSSGSYYTKSDLNGGALDFLYYTQNDLNVTGVLDSRYYTETEIDANFAPLVHTHVSADITDFPPAGYVVSINTITPVLGNVTLNLNDLNDVTNALPTDKHVIVMRSGAYVNDFLTTDDLLDVDTTASIPVIGDILIHNGGGFVNRPLIKNDISDFLGTEFVLVTNVAGDAPAGDGPPDSSGTPQDIYGVKTFKDGVVIESSLTVSGTNTSIQTTELKVTDQYIDINWGETGVGVTGPGVAGIRVDRGPLVGSPSTINPPAIIQWDEGTKQWEVGVEGNANKIITGAHQHLSTDVTDFSARVVTELAANNLAAIADVTYLVSPSTGEYLRYGVGTWENKDFATDVTTELNVNALDQMQDVVYLGSPALTAGDFLQWNGTQWENHVAVKADISDFVEGDYLHTNATAEVKAGDLTINGDFTVGGGIGTVTTINSATVNILDSVITLNAGELGNGVAGGTGTSGILVDRGTAGIDAMLYWSEPAKTWVAHHTITAGSPPSPTLTIGQLSFDGHQHVVSDITDLAANANELNTLVGINTGTTVQAQLTDKISRQGDSMAANADLTFVLGEALGLPAIPSVNDAATSKLYVNDQDTLITLSLNTHITDLTLHMTADQNAFFDGLTLTGSPALTSGDVNQLIGISGNVQTLLDTKADKVSGATLNNFATLDGTGNLLDSGLILNDAGTLVSEIWSANKIDTTKADKVSGATLNNFATLDGTGNLTDSGLILNDAGVLASEIWSANQIDTTKVDKVPTAVVSNFGEFDAIGNLIDGGNNPSTFAAAVHTHVAADVTDLNTALNTYITGTMVLDDISDVTVAVPAVSDIIQWSGAAWNKVAPTTVFGPDFVRKSGSVAEAITGVKTFNDNAIFSSDVSITGNLTVSGTNTDLDVANLTVTDKNITINANYVGATSGSTGSGIHAVRNVGTGSPTGDPLAVILWDDGLSGGRWTAGLDGSEEAIALENVTVATPDYELWSADGTNSHTYGFSVASPAAGKATLQVFVNGIKKTQGAGKAYTVVYGTSTVTFNVGDVPQSSDDVEFYGFGVIG